MRRPTTLELMLLATIGLWSLNLTVSRYILTHGLQPLAYGSVRYLLAAGVFCGITLVAERSLRVARRDLALLFGAAAVLYVNQLAFVYALHESTASVLALLLGATPIFAAIAGVLLGTETLARRFWSGALLSFAGVALVAIGSGDEVSGSLVGALLGELAAATRAGYSMLITPLMRRYSASRISTIVLGATCLPLTLTAVPQLADQDWSLGWAVWLLVVFATLGPLVATNVMWFRSLDRIGPARATLAANLQPFVAALVAVVLLSETLGLLEVAGGLLIATGIVAARRRAVSTPPGE
jgi:drug/metabolite transporter (DMT)-like permease